MGAFISQAAAGLGLERGLSVSSPSNDHIDDLCDKKALDTVADERILFPRESNVTMAIIIPIH